MNRPNVNIERKHVIRQHWIIELLYLNRLEKDYDYYELSRLSKLSPDEFRVVISDLKDLGLIDYNISISKAKTKFKLTMKGREYYLYMESGQGLE